MFTKLRSEIAKSSKIGEKFVRPTLFRYLKDFKEIPQQLFSAWNVDVHLYKKVFRKLLYSTGINCQISCVESKNGLERTSL